MLGWVDVISFTYAIPLMKKKESKKQGFIK